MAYSTLVSLEQTITQILHPRPFAHPLNHLLVSIRQRALLLQSFLQSFPHQAHDFEGRVREVGVKAEDLIEHILFEDDYESSNPSVRSSEAELREVLKEMELVGRDVQMKLSGKKPRQRDYVGRYSLSRRRSTIAGEVIGFEDELNHILDRLINTSFPAKRQVLPILGTGGTGKTTLARLAYDHPLISEHFPIRCWVTVSQVYSVKSIHSKLLASIKVKGGIVVDGESDEDKIRRYLKGGRYLIVMDDMWSKKTWDDVKMLFLDDKNGSRLILTTRLSDVAAYADPSSPIISMRMLNEEESWRLLQRRVFGHYPCPLKLEANGRQIVKSCRGLPLSIVVVAGLLSSIGLSESIWEQIAANDGKLETILWLSYTHLLPDMMACFVYMGGFPEDYEINASQLIKLWVAERFIRPSAYLHIEKVAEEHLEDLAVRSLVVVNSRKYDGRIKSCSLHDMVRDFCIKQAQQEKLLLPVMDYLPTPILRRHFLPRPRVLKNHRRLSLTSYDLNAKVCMHGSHIRSIICIKQKGYKSVGSVDECSSLRVLHVLRDDDDWDHWEPGQVFNLVHLTYLASYIPTSIVPPTISKLRNLQTLIIYRFDVCLPVEIWRLRNLKHLMAFSFHPIPHPEEEALPLPGLLTLSLVNNFVCSGRMVRMIPGVKKLGVCYFEENKSYLHNLQLLSKLENLKLKLEMRSDTSFGACLCNAFPRSLRKLTLSGLRISWLYMSVVGSLPHLQVLKLRNYACDGDCWKTNENEFVELQVLLIDESNLRHWITEKKHFPSLHHLIILRCPYLSEIPSDLASIPAMELLRSIINARLFGTG